MNKEAKIRELESRIKILEKLLDPREEVYGRVILPDRGELPLIEEILLRLTNLEGVSPI